MLKNTDKRFDIDLKFGEIFEDKLAEIFTKKKIEVKTERDIWAKTGNIAIECSYRGQLSGLQATEADWWAQILTINNDIKGILLFPREELKEILNNMLDRKDARVVYGGDDSESKLVLAPLSKLFKEII